ncbi:MAG: UvrD-helicase domain-containing protein [Opitutaceae bacterium]|nr:UvrD-helicase domain-containing protein [Opitutaceae bacterium]
MQVEKVPAGDVRLRGGKAVYDPDALLILHEDAEDEFREAFLVAHEIGHIELGGEFEPSVAIDPDPARAAEAAPIGQERVVDYNRRARREIQADVFAREFLLPRQVMRHLHVQQGETATAIAARFRAPFAAVAQQLLDGLLLPTVQLDGYGSRDTKPLNADQFAAVRHLSSPYLLEAGPGTGKTQTLVERIEYLLSQGVEPGRILVLTFSNKAAGELTERVLSRQPNATAIWIGTFHAFGLDLIRRFHDRLGLPSDPRLMDRAEAVEMLEQELPRLGLVHFNNLWDPSLQLREILAAISRANDEVVDAGRYRQLAEATRAAANTPKDIKTAERILEVASVYAAYEARKKELACLDFGDLVSAPVRLCEGDPEVRSYLIAHYGHVLVDEFQDVNRSSVRLLKALSPSGQNLWVVGDAKQSIYRFRGASAFNIRRFGTQDFPGATSGRLTINYRSVEEIANAFVHFAQNGMRVAENDVRVSAHRDRLGSQPEYLAVDSAENEICAVAEQIRKLRDAGQPYRNQAILCSGVERLSKFAAGLEALEIPVLYLGSLFERDEVRDLLSILSLVVDRRAMGLVRVATKNSFAMPLSDVAATLAYFRENAGQALDWTKQIDAIQNLSPAGKANLSKVAALVEGFERSAAPWTVLAAILFDRTRMAADMSIATDSKTRSQAVAIWQLMNFVRARRGGPAGYPITRLLDSIRRMVLLADERDLRQLPEAAQGIDAVRIMTIHASKGLEFPVVHLPGMTAAALPRAATLGASIPPPDGMIEGAVGNGVQAVLEAHVEEQECLFFVALSRAQDRLFLYSPTKKANGHKLPRSPFIDRLGQTIILGNATPVIRLPEEPENQPVRIVFEGTLTVTDFQLALFERCARRFLYTHVLKVGGRRTESTFMKMHTAVQDVLNWLSRDLASDPTIAEVDARIDEAWKSVGPWEHASSAELRQIAGRLIAFYLQRRRGYRRTAPPALRFVTEHGHILVKPDQALSNSAGAITLRRVSTRHHSSEDDDSLATAAFQLAADGHASGYTLELLYLTDDVIAPVDLSPRVLSNRRASVADALRDIRAGKFPAKQSLTCARCPCFFICGPLPEGSLSTKSLSD